MKLLISAYSCCPTKTSEPGNAWRAINEALREHEVWAVIGHHYQERTEAFLAKNPMPGFSPIFVKLSPALVSLRGRDFSIRFTIISGRKRSGESSTSCTNALALICRIT